MSVLAISENRRAHTRLNGSHDFGTSFFGSMNGLLTTIALRGPAGVTISISVPSSERGGGTQAYAMVFLTRGDIASTVRIPIYFPSFPTGRGYRSQDPND